MTSAQSGRTQNTLRRFFFAASTLLLTLPVALNAQPNPESQTIIINARDAGTPFPHFWEQIFGSGRAILSLRQSYRDDLHTVKNVTDLRAVRFHGIFLDEVGLYDPDAMTQNPGQAPEKVKGAGIYNFSY